LSRTTVSRLIQNIALPREQWIPLVRYDTQQFHFHTLVYSQWLEVNLIGWKPGQWSSVHDHRGTECAVLVLQGTLSNQDYEVRSDERLVETSRCRLCIGEHLMRPDRQIHSCGNDADAPNDLVTLHVYSPALLPLSQRRHR